MSELSRLLGKSEEVELKDMDGNPVKFKIEPLTVGDLDLISGMSGDNVTPSAMKPLIEKVLKDSFPDSTEKEINGFPLRLVNELSEHIVRINELGSKDDAKAKLVSRLKK